MLHNLWLLARESELVLKRASFLYALMHRVPFCLCMHIMLTMLEMRDEHQIGLPFACLVTKICLHFVHDIADIGPKERTKDTLGMHMVMKSDAQLRYEDHEEAKSPQPTPSVLSDPAAASSSTQTALLAFDAMLSHILDTVLSIQREVNTMRVRVEQNHINIRRCLKQFELEDDDDDDDGWD